MNKSNLIERLEHFKIPLTEYSFSGGLPKDCLCVEEREGAWEVYYSDGKEKIMRGRFVYDIYAYDFLFYLVMKKHVDVKKRWW